MPIFPRYEAAEWVPWRAMSAAGQVNYYASVMSRERPADGAVLHIMEGYMTTARQWALGGHYGASWHFSVGRDGQVMQHLDLEHGGYHAGVSSRQTAWAVPTWRYWRGSGVNVNHHSIGIEHEGFAHERGLTEAQTVASIALCRWLVGVFGWEWERERFPPHADIDLVNRPNDFGFPEVRAAHYARMFAPVAGVPPKEEEMTEAETRALVAGMLTEALTPVERRLERLNEALIMRMRLHRLADNPDYDEVETALNRLRALGQPL